MFPLVHSRLTVIPLLAFALQLMPFSLCHAAHSDDYGTQICGPRCACFILESFGRNCSLRESVEKILAQDVANGCSLNELDLFFKTYGLSTEAIIIDFHSPPEFSGFMISAIKRDHDLSHFVVVLRVHPQEGVLFYDGLLGLRSVPTSSFLQSIHKTSLIVHNGELIKITTWRSLTLSVVALLQAALGLFLIGLFVVKKSLLCQRKNP